MRYIVFFILLLGLWLMFTFSLKWDSLVIGACCAAITAAFFGRYFDAGLKKLLDPTRYLWAVLYLFVFSWECFKANLDVAYRVLHPGLPIKPGIVKVKLDVKTELGRAMLANSITMTPGTITVDIIEDHIYIHWIYVSTKDPVMYSRRICGRFETYIRRIFE
ncbi:MAG: Na+/H+ antiporter subunit E [Bacteroidales bacterium]|nr:Na+/H+ antiporter subunit E [Bacteroidales bacterium]